MPYIVTVEQGIPIRMAGPRGGRFYLRFKNLPPGAWIVFAYRLQHNEPFAAFWWRSDLHEGGWLAGAADSQIPIAPKSSISFFVP